MTQDLNQQVILLLNLSKETLVHVSMYTCTSTRNAISCAM